MAATIVSVGAFVLAGYAWYQYRDLDNGVTRVKINVGQPPSGKKDIDGTDQNILLVGNDDRTKMTDAEVKALHVGRDGGSMSTDTMMIMHIPADGKKATLISLPRDSYVAIPGHSKNRLNAAYVDGYNSVPSSAPAAEKQQAGAQLLFTTVQNLTGLTLNDYVQISLLGFYEISKAIGGIDVDMCRAVNDTHAHNVANGDDGGSGLKVPKGKQHLNAVQTLEFVRQRHNFPDGQGDLDRVKRQQYFLTAAFRKVAGVGLISELNSLKSAIKRNVVLGNSVNLLDLANQMQNLSANNIVGKTIPFERFANLDVGSVQIVNPARVQRFVATAINPPAPSSPSTIAAAGPSRGKPSTTPGHSSSSPVPIDAKCIN